MRLRLLLLFIGIASMLGAQELYDSTLVITEVMGMENHMNNNYIELTNIGDHAIDLADMKFVKISTGATQANCNYLNTRHWNYSAVQDMFYLPESVTKVLQPGECYVMSVGNDFMLNGYKMGIPEFDFGDRISNHSINDISDFVAHREEHGYYLWDYFGHIVKDSAIYSPDSAYTHGDYVYAIGQMQVANKGFFIEQHFLDSLGQPDSAVIDQVRCTFSDQDCEQESVWWDVGGLSEATRDAILFRRSTTAKGNLNWYEARSYEWFAIRYPAGWDNWRDYWWTIGNHDLNGDWVLDASTLVPKAGENIVVDYPGKQITVPWGTRRLDDIMRRLEYTEGIAWVYILNDNVQDSLFRSAQNGDRLAVFRLGVNLYTDTFDIVVNEPLNSDNIVIPVDHMNTGEVGGPISDRVQNGKLGWPRVTSHGGSETMDTITGAGRGIPFNTRIDSLYKYLEKPDNASWDIVFVDGQTRADLKSGDKLKVTSENGSVKEYLIQVRADQLSDNNNLSSITWPDIDLSVPDMFKYGWDDTPPFTRDTVPGFTTSILNYRLMFPASVQSIPALVAKPAHVNARVLVDRAWTWDGGAEDRTTSFTVIAENDSVQVFTVEMAKEIDTSEMQKWEAEPFVSYYIHKSNKKNLYAEICNPGNVNLDLSQYMITFFAGPPEEALSVTFSNDSAGWLNRYNKFIPGRRWRNIDVADGWQLNPNTLDIIPDDKVYPIVAPGDVFVLANINFDEHLSGLEDPLTWPGYNEVFDVVFQGIDDYDDSTFPDGTYNTWPNTWGEEMNLGPFHTSTGQRSFYIFKIIGEGGDSVRAGLKPATNENDFELIEIISMDDYTSKWNPTGVKAITQGDAQTRKPEIVFPNDVPEGSFGATPEDSEWIYHDTGNDDNLANEGKLGQHFFYPYTGHMSGVKSPVYAVSKGFSSEESIDGVLTGTLLEAFMGNIYKANEAATLFVISGQDTLKTGEALSLNDTLVVISLDGTNMTRYGIGVSSEGLSNDAKLTSSVYTVAVDGNTGSVAGMEFSTLLPDVVDNVTVPAGAALTVVDANSGFVPYRKLDIMGMYFDATANYETYFEVVAENKTTTVVYQLQPTMAEDDVFVLSDLYEVSQDLMLIKSVPFGTSYEMFLMNIMPSPGAMVQVLDKSGYERTDGAITEDDRLVVTSGDGTITKVYYLAMIDLETGILSVSSLAYITSDVYTIDQVSLGVDGVSVSTSISAFLNNITPSEGATVVVVDSDGIEKVSGDIVAGDKVKVTSGNGGLTVVYLIGDLSTGLESLHGDHIKLYPNPTNSLVNIEGLNPGSRIQVYNVMGAMLQDVYSFDPHTVISLDHESDGMYFIVVSDKDNAPLGRYKVLKKQ